VIPVPNELAIVVVKLATFPNESMIEAGAPDESRERQQRADLSP